MHALQEFLREHHVPYMEGGTHRHVRYGWTGLQCPYCQTTSWHLGVRDSDGFTSCWRCGPHKLSDVLIAITGLPWHKLRGIVRQIRSAVRTPGGVLKADRPTSVVTPKGVTDLLDAHRAYLKGRNFDPDDIADIWDVQGIGIHARLSWRLFIPITVHGHVVSWTTRGIGEGASRYISAGPNEESYPHKDVLYGADRADHTVVVTEGPTDAWRIGPGGVAVLGLQVSEAQVLEIGAHPVRVICFDNSSNARRRMDKLANRLSLMAGETHVVQIETGEDPASMAEGELRDLRTKFML